MCPSAHHFICTAVRPSLNFLKIGSLVFSDTVHDNSWPWYLVIDAVKFLKKKTGSLNQTQNKVFGIFLSLDQTFSFKLHRIIACNNVSHLVEEKFTKKNLGPKIVPENSFFAIFSSLVHNVVGFHHPFSQIYIIGFPSLILHKIAAWDNVQHPVELKPPEKHFSLKWGPSRPMSGPQWGFPAFTFFIKRGKILLNWYLLIRSGLGRSIEILCSVDYI